MECLRFYPRQIHWFFPIHCFIHTYMCVYTHTHTCMFRKLLPAPEHVWAGAPASARFFFVFCQPLSELSREVGGGRATPPPPTETANYSGVNSRCSFTLCNVTPSRLCFWVCGPFCRCVHSSPDAVLLITVTLSQALRLKITKFSCLKMWVNAHRSHEGCMLVAYWGQV